MIINDLVQEEIDLILKLANFNAKQEAIFIMRAKGVTLEEISFKLDMPISTVKYNSRKINKKIIKLL